MDSRLRCKFVVNEITHEQGGVGRLSAWPVTSGSEENEQFFRYTPGGKLELSVVRAETLARLKPGQELYLDLVPISPEPEQA